MIRKTRSVRANPRKTRPAKAAATGIPGPLVDQLLSETAQRYAQAGADAAAAYLAAKAQPQQIEVSFPAEMNVNIVSMPPSRRIVKRDFNGNISEVIDG